MKCGEVPNFPNGEYGDECSADSNVNTTCTTTCNDGYYRNGSENATCADLASNNDMTGEWDFDTTCTRKSCIAAKLQVKFRCCIND